MSRKAILTTFLLLLILLFRLILLILLLVPFAEDPRPEATFLLRLFRLRAVLRRFLGVRRGSRRTRMRACGARLRGRKRRFISAYWLAGLTRAKHAGNAVHEGGRWMQRTQLGGLRSFDEVLG